MEPMVVWNGACVSPTWDVIRGSRASGRCKPWQEAHAALRHVAKRRAALNAEESAWIRRIGDARVQLGNQESDAAYGQALSGLICLGWKPEEVRAALEVVAFHVGHP